MQAQRASAARAPASSPDPIAQADALAAALAATSDLADRIGLVRASLTGRLAFSTSLGIEDQVILDAIAAGGHDVDVFTLDTGRLFPETLDVLDASSRRYGVPIRVLSPMAGAVEAVVARDGVLGFRSSVAARKACCDVRKVEPLRRGLAGARGWITGLRRAQATTRTDIAFAAWDPAFALIKVNPLADWSLADVERYAARRDVPVNALHVQGFPSIGCQPCTRAIRPGEDVRAGRWWWENEDGKECGLHKRPVNAAQVTT